MNRRRFLLSAAALTGCRPAPAPDGLLRLGHFPNVTHLQALVARSFSREGRGWFEERLGRGDVTDGQVQVVHDHGARASSTSRT